MAADHRFIEAVWRCTRGALAVQMSFLGLAAGEAAEFEGCVAK